MIPLSPHHLATIYDALRQLPPFSEWKRLPEGDAIEFSSPLRLDCQGEYSYPPHKITISCAKVGNWQTVIAVMLHEMAHLSCFIDGTFKPNYHGSAFKKKARRISKLYGLDDKAF